jgi:hypothetical protein
MLLMLQVIDGLIDCEIMNWIFHSCPQKEIFLMIYIESLDSRPFISILCRLSRAVSWCRRRKYLMPTKNSRRTASRSASDNLTAQELGARILRSQLTIPRVNPSAHYCVVVLGS